MTGKTTVVDKKTSVSGKRIGSLSNASVQMREVARPLLTPDECMRLKGPLKDESGRITEPGDMLIFVAGYNAVYGQQILFFMDMELLKRSQIPAP
jgi:type IV secretion system protein VirD4